MLTAIIGIGPPASGKTELLKQLAQEQSCTYICSNDLRLELQDRIAEHKFNERVWTEIYRMIETELSNGRNVVIDASNTRAEERKDLALHCQKFRSKVVGVWFMVPVEECLRRNRMNGRIVPENVIIRMARDLEINPPSMWDGFDEILKVGKS